MCIRDSPATPERDRHAVPAVCGRGGGDEVQDFGHAQDYSCLLYTSDAADERSSVDLGGRRIIKKKKKMSHMSSTKEKEAKQEERATSE